MITSTNSLFQITPCPFVHSITWGRQSVCSLFHGPSMGMSFALSSFRIPQKPCPQAAFKSRQRNRLGREGNEAYKGKKRPLGRIMVQAVGGRAWLEENDSHGEMPGKAEWRWGFRTIGCLNRRHANLPRKWGGAWCHGPHCSLPLCTTWQS